jgi:hypothetical protein
MMRYGIVRPYLRSFVFDGEVMIGKYSGVVYDSHAVDRLRLRKISASQVERAIANPDTLTPSTNPPGRLVAEQRTAKGATLRVVFTEQETTAGTVAYVITAMRIGR